MKKTINKLLFKGILILGEGTSCDGLLDKEKGMHGGIQWQASCLACHHLSRNWILDKFCPRSRWSFFNDDQD